MSGIIDNYRPQSYGRVTTTGSVSAARNLAITKIGTGTYRLEFATPMRTATYPVLITLAGSGFGIQGNATVDFATMDANSVVIYTTDSTGTLTDTRFCAFVP